MFGYKEVETVMVSGLKFSIQSFEIGLKTRQIITVAPTEISANFVMIKSVNHNPRLFEPP